MLRRKRTTAEYLYYWFWLLLLFVFVLCTLNLIEPVASKGAKNKATPRQRDCKYQSALPTFQSSVSLLPKTKTMTVWPYEKLYMKAKLSVKPLCGAFEMRVVDLPLRRLSYEEGAWQLLGEDYSKEDRARNRYKSAAKAAEAASADADDDKPENSLFATYTEDIPVHLLRIRPPWAKSFFCKTLARIRAGVFCAMKFTPYLKYVLYYDRCKQFEYEKLLVDSEAKCAKYNLRWGGSLFSRKSKTFKVSIWKKYFESMYPGAQGMGAIAENSLVYKPYDGYRFVLNQIKTILGLRLERLKKLVGVASTDSSETAWNPNHRIHFVPLLYYSQWDTDKCKAQCVRYLPHKYPFKHVFTNFVAIEPSERLGRIKMKWKQSTTNNVHEYSASEYTVPNVCTLDTKMKFSLRLQRYCNSGGPCIKKSRSIFGKDGWDLFRGETIQFELDLMGNEKYFKVGFFQIPFLSRLFGAYSLIFGAGYRKKSMSIKPKEKFGYQTHFEMRYRVTLTGAFHRWYLFYPKMFVSMGLEYQEGVDDGSIPPDMVMLDQPSHCNKLNNEWAPTRPQLGCRWPKLRLMHTQSWTVKPPKPGEFKHSLMTKFKFAFLNVGETKCGKTTALLEKWPSNPKKNYVKLLIVIEGPQGGLTIEGGSGVLRFPARRNVISIGKYKKKWCLKAHFASEYTITFKVFGSLKWLFPTQPQTLYTSAALGRLFEIAIPNEMHGDTVLNNEWTDHYTITINAFPDPEKSETDIVLVPVAENVQFEPSQIAWSPNLPRRHRKRKKKFRFRPMLDCAFGGVTMHISWEVSGMVNRIVPNPLEPTPIRVKEDVPSDGCDKPDEATPEEFVPFDTSEANVDPELNLSVPNATPIAEVLPPSNLKTQGLDFVTAVIILCFFALIVLVLFAIGFLGKDEEFELVVANQLKDALIRKQKRAMAAKMNSTNDQFIDPHYEQNVERRKQFAEKNYLNETF